MTCAPRLQETSLSSKCFYESILQNAYILANVSFELSNRDKKELPIRVRESYAEFFLMCMMHNNSNPINRIVNET